MNFQRPIGALFFALLAPPPIALFAKTEYDL